MEDPRLRRIRQRPERPLLDWTRIREAAEHSWYLIQKPWPGAAIDTTLDWERAKLLWVTRNVDPHAWSPLRTMAHAALVRVPFHKTKRAGKEAGSHSRLDGRVALDGDRPISLPGPRRLRTALKRPPRWWVLLRAQLLRCAGGTVAGRWPWAAWG